LNAQFAIKLALQCGVIPAVGALAVFVAVSWLWPPELARRYRSGLALSLGVFIGFVLLPDTKTLAPEQFWEWFPPLGVLAALLAGLTRAEGVRRGERWSAMYIFAAISASLIVPHWAELVPAWPVQWAWFAVGIVALTALLMPLPELFSAVGFPWWLMLAAAATSALMMDQVSVIFGKLAALPAGALAGCGIAAFFFKAPIDWRSLMLPYSILVGGYAYTGHVYPTTPVRAMLLLPLAPLMLWLCARGPLARLSGARAIAVHALLVLAPLLIVAVYLLTNSASDEW
jgi:hypothetical protein